MEADGARPHLPVTSSSESAGDLKHSSTSAKFSRFGKKLLSKRNKSADHDEDEELDSAKFPLFRKESSAAQNRDRQQDVQDFLSAGGTVKLTDSGEKRKLALIPPKLNTVAAKEAPSANTIGTPTAGVPENYDNGRYEPWVPAKPRRREGLQVAFLQHQPEIIGHGGDETEDPVLVIGHQRKNSIPEQPPVPLRKFSTQDDLDFVPKPMKRTQTGLSDSSDPGAQQQTVLPGPPIPPLPPQYLQERQELRHARTAPPQSAFDVSPEVSPDVEVSQIPVFDPPPMQFEAPLERNPSLRRMRAAEGMTFRLSGSFDPPPFTSQESLIEDDSHLRISPYSRRHSDISMDSGGHRPASGGSSLSDVSQMSDVAITRKPLPTSVSPIGATQQPTLPDISQLDLQRPQAKASYDSALYGMPASGQYEDSTQLKDTGGKGYHPEELLQQTGHSQPPPIPRKPTSATPRDSEKDPTTLVGYGKYVAHQSSIFQMAAGSLRSLPSAMEWARTATWWFLRARCGMEEIVKAKASPEEAQSEAFKTALLAHQLNLAKVRWILLEVLPSYAEVNSEVAVVETLGGLTRAFEALLRSMGKRDLLPTEQLHVRSGLDSSLWHDSPFDQYAQAQLIGREAHRVVEGSAAANVFPFLPLTEGAHCLVLQRTYARCVIAEQDVSEQREPFVALLTLVRDVESFDLSLLFATQGSSLDTCVGLALGPTLPLHDITGDGSKEDPRQLRATLDGQSSSLLVPFIFSNGHRINLQCFLRHVDFSRFTSLFQSSSHASMATQAQASEDHSPAYTAFVADVAYTSFLVSSSTRDLEASWRTTPGLLHVFHQAVEPLGSADRHSRTSASSRPHSAASSNSNASNAEDDESHKHKRSERLRERMMQGRALFGKGLDKLQRQHHSRERSTSSIDRSQSLSPNSQSRQSRLTLAATPASRRLESAELRLLGNPEKQQISIEPFEGQMQNSLRIRIKEDVSLQIGRRARMQEICLGFADEGERRRTWEALEGFGNVGKWV